jgi:formamidopyrimidine-DNA glycosylase
VPELPEVETVVRDLRPSLAGRRFTAILRASKDRLRKPWKPAWHTPLVGKTIEQVRRRGKWIVLDLEGGQHLVFHLGMTGQLTVTAADTEPTAHTHLVFTLDDGKHLRFRDIRRFGSATLFTSDRALTDFFDAAGLGPEPFDLEPDAWRDSLASTSRCLKAVLLDQGVVAGVGNIYADEALFEAQVHPAVLGRRLDESTAERLRQAVVAVLQRAIAGRGSSVRNYVDGAGQPGEFQNEHQVYGRAGQPCPRCGTAIVSVRLAGRSSHFCPSCQPAPRRAATRKGAAKRHGQEGRLKRGSKNRP